MPFAGSGRAHSPLPQDSNLTARSANPGGVASAVNLLQLKYFVGIAHHGSFASAARALFVTQPSLSQHVKNLENELGVALLQRNARGVRLTDEGRELVHHATAILERLEAARTAIRDASAAVVGSVTLGVPPTISELVTVPLILRVREELPGVSLKVVEGMSGYVLNWLQEGRVDLAVLYDVQGTQGITTIELYQEDLYLISPVGEGRRRKTASFAELPGTTLVLPGEHQGLRMLLETLAQQQHVDLQVQVEVDALSQMRALVEAGVGCTVLPLWAVKEALAHGTVRAQRIVAPAVQRTMSIAYSSERPLGKAERALIERLQEQLKAPR